MSEMPKKRPGVRICVSVMPDGVTIYGNRSAFASIAEWMQWVMTSPPNEHFETHLLADLEDDASKFEGKHPRNVWTLVDGRLTSEAGGAPLNAENFDVTFMAVEESELDKMEKYQDGGLLPDDWVRSRDE